MVRRTSFRRRKTRMRPATEFQFGWDSFPGRSIPLSPLPASPSQGDGGRQVLKTHVSEWFQQIWNAKIIVTNDSLFVAGGTRRMGRPAGNE
jgi:hypothetical protein